MNRINNRCVVVTRMVVLAVTFLFVTASVASAAFVEDYFNGYGATNANLTGKGAAGGGWASGWTGTTGPSYQAGSQLTYAGTGYDNSGNNATASDGYASFGSANTGSLSTRTFDSGLTGTVWISWLSSNEGNASFAAQFSFDGSINNHFRILDGTTGNRAGAYNNSNAPITPTLGEMPAYTPGTTALLLTKVDMNYSGALDRVTVWLNPDLTSGLASIGSGFVLGDSADAFGATFDSISVSFSRDFGAIDAIRVSNDLDGFFDVTGYVEFIPPAPIPEPSSLLLLGLALPLLARRRTRK